jgi:hypothetical protein
MGPGIGDPLDSSEYSLEEGVEMVKDERKCKFAGGE